MLANQCASYLGRYTQGKHLLVAADQYSHQDSHTAIRTITGNIIPRHSLGIPTHATVRSSSSNEAPPLDAPRWRSRSLSVWPDSTICATTPSLLSTLEPSPPPVRPKHQPYMLPSPRSASNAAWRQVGGSWRVPLRSRGSRRRSPAAPLCPSGQPCDSESYPPPTSHHHRHHRHILINPHDTPSASYVPRPATQTRHLPHLSPSRNAYRRTRLSSAHANLPSLSPRPYMLSSDPFLRPFCLLPSYLFARAYT
ncbi:hypothetical protein EDB84DRAFT_1521378, partial [Lactarius hengduanensis]